MSDPISLDYVRELEAQNVCLAEAANHAAAVLGKNEAALDIYWIKTGRRADEDVAQMKAPATGRRFAARYRELEAIAKAAREFLALQTQSDGNRVALEKALRAHDVAEKRRTKRIQAAAKKGEPWWEVEP